MTRSMQESLELGEFPDESDLKDLNDMRLAGQRLSSNSNIQGNVQAFAVSSGTGSPLTQSK